MVGAWPNRQRSAKSKPQTSAFGALVAGFSGGSLLADVGQESHIASPLDGVLDRSLEGGAVAAALAAKEFALARAHLFQTLHILVVDEGRPGAALFGAEPAAIFSASSQLLANHGFLALSLLEPIIQSTEEIKIAICALAVNDRPE